MNILIPNASSKKNIGDLAALESLISILRKNFGNNAFITVHSYEPEMHRSNLAERIDYNLYAWVAFADKRVFKRFIRLAHLLALYFTNRFRLPIFKRSKLQELINDYKRADLIVFVGGGYLRPKTGILPSINLFMLLSLFAFAKLFPAKKIICPMSFGPFAYEWQERIAARTLRGLSVVSVRERISYELLTKKYRLSNIILSCDFALLLSGLKINDPIGSKPILGFTIRDWFEEKKQKDFEYAFAKAVIQFAKNFDIKIQPIIQVDGGNGIDFDELVTENIVKYLKQNGIIPLPSIKITSVEQALDVYANVALLLGMRMHSNILAAVSGTPFVAISYEYKTEGVVEQLNNSEYVIKSEDVDEHKLLKLLITAYKNKSILSNTLLNSIQELKSKELLIWNGIFSN